MQKLMAGIAAGVVAPAISGAHPVELYRRLIERMLRLCRAGKLGLAQRIGSRFF